MRRTTALALVAALAALLPALASAEKKVPAQIALARYVCLGYETGRGFVSESQTIGVAHDIYPEDRRALDAVRSALEKWGKYVVTVGAHQADLLIAVRAGRRAGASIGIGGGFGTGGGRARGGFGSAGGAGAEISTDDDLLIVYDRAGTQLWREQGHGLFSGTPPRAFEQLRKDVESTPVTPDKPKK